MKTPKAINDFLIDSLHYSSNYLKWLLDGSQFPLVQNILIFLEFCCISLGFFGHSTSVAILPAMNHDYIKLL